MLIANMKASIVALYYMHRDWDQTENFPASLGNNNLQWARKVKAVLEEFCASCSKWVVGGWPVGIGVNGWVDAYFGYRLAAGGYCSAAAPAWRTVASVPALIALCAFRNLGLTLVFCLDMPGPTPHAACHVCAREAQGPKLCMRVRKRLAGREVCVCVYVAGT